MDYTQIFQNQFSSISPVSNDPLIFTALLLLLIWSIVWKGLALWKAAKNGAKVWFIVLLIGNTIGILEILYYFYFSKKKAK